MKFKLWQTLFCVTLLGLGLSHGSIYTASKAPEKVEAVDNPAVDTAKSVTWKLKSDLLCYALALYGYSKCSSHDTLGFMVAILCLVIYTTKPDLLTVSKSYHSA